MAFKSTMLFDVLENIMTKKSEDLLHQHLASENYKDAAKFMIIRYLSMASSAEVRDIVIRNCIQLERMDDSTLYRWLLKNIPKQRNSFIRYIR